MTGGLVMIVRGCLMLEPGNCLGYQIFNFLDGKNWRNEMSVDNRIPSEPYIELNGVTVYTEGVYRHGKLPEITKGTIGEKLMDREYNGLGVANDESIERFNDLIDRLIYYMDEGDSVTITGIADREFNVVINSTKIRGGRNE
nr:MAG TPA: hypothetical protein [Caudoviricetes sp.]